MDLVLLIGGVAVVLAFTGGVIRDLPWREGRTFVVMFTAPVLLVMAIFVAVGGLRTGAALGVAFGVVFGSFTIATGGHVLRGAGGNLWGIEVPETIRQRYMQHTTRYAFASMLLMVCVFGAGAELFAAHR